MFYKRKWFLAAMLTGGALALAGCDDSGISQKTYDIASKNAAKLKSLADGLTSDLAEAEKKLANAQKALKTATDSAKMANDKVVRLTSEAVEADEALANAWDSAEIGADTVGTLTFKLTKANEDLTKAKENVVRLTSEAVEADEALANAWDSAEIGADTVGTLTFKLTKANEDLTKANEDLTKANEDLTKANEDLTKANEDLTKANENVVRLTSEAVEADEALAIARDSAEIGADTVGTLTFKLTKANENVETLRRQLLTPMIRAAYSGMKGADGARPGVLAGIDKPTISPSASPESDPSSASSESDPSSASPESVSNVYDEFHRPTIVQMSYDGENLSKELVNRDVAPIVGGYDGYRFEGETGKSNEKAYVVLYTDKRDRRASSKTPGIDDYLTFGVWLTVPKDTNVKHSVGAYATGGDPFKGNFANLEGTATYEGPAVGIYGKRAAGTGTSDVGSFTATASLTANFNKGSVYGYVMNFMEKGDDLEWKVKLDYEGAPDSGGATQISKTGEEADMIGSGMWTGQFYGNGEQPSDHPGYFAGTFNTKTGTPAKKKTDDQGFLGIVGAFGAKLQ